MRRHHNNTGYRQIKNGKTYEQVERIKERIMTTQREKLIKVMQDAFAKSPLEKFSVHILIHLFADALLERFCVQEHVTSNSEIDDLTYTAPKGVESCINCGRAREEGK